MHSLTDTISYSGSKVNELIHLGTEEGVHSFKWIIPYVIGHQFEIKQRSLRILEYGPGCNSEQFLTSNVCEHLVSIEDNSEWYEKFASTISKVPAVEVDYKFIEVKSIEGKAYHGGHCWTEEEILSYAEYPLKYGNRYFDIIFIDAGDRQDNVTIRGKTYRGWPIRNIALELAHSLLIDKGVAIIHDIPGPYPKMNKALGDNTRTFKHTYPVEEFYTTILSDSLDLVPLKQYIRKRYRLGFHTWIIPRFLRSREVTWYQYKITRSLMKSWMRL